MVTNEAPRRKPAAAQGSLAGISRQLLVVPEAGILIPLIIVTAFFQYRNPILLTSDSIGALLRALSFVGIIAVGQTMLMVSGELDLSVGAVAGFCSVVTALLMAQGHGNWPIWAAVAVGLAAGAVIGLINGLVAVRLGIPAFITTLGMMYVARGATMLITGGNPIYPLPDAFNNFGDATPLHTSWSFVLLLIIAAIGDFVLRRTTYGRMICATGGNREVAQIAGINTRVVKICCYTLTGTLAALAGILIAANFNSGTPQTGTGYELNVIAAVVIGGVSLFGGLGTVLGTFLGLLIIQVIQNGLVLMGVSPNWQTVAIGMIMVAAVGFDLLRRRAKTA